MAALTLAEIMAGKPDVDFARTDATTEENIRREDGYDPDEAIRDEDVISPASASACAASVCGRYPSADRQVADPGAGSDPDGPECTGFDDHSGA
jgi:hypothetical protein